MPILLFLLIIALNTGFYIFLLYAFLLFSPPTLETAQVSDKKGENVWWIGLLFVIFDKIGCISTKKIKKRFFILFCLRFALSLQRICDMKSYR